ncbi:hypothetical protein ACVWWK_003129 [Bradyrhizobium sp. LB9.1b]
MGFEHTAIIKGECSTTGMMGTCRQMGGISLALPIAERCFRVTRCCEDNMPGIGSKLPPFDITGVKPGFHLPEENGQSAFETLTDRSFPENGKSSTFSRRISHSSAQPKSVSLLAYPSISPMRCNRAWWLDR